MHSKLASKYLHVGYIVPPAPEKSIVGMTKVKVGKEDSSSTEFVEKRRAALERYLQRTVKHPTLLQDPDLRQFLESSELPRAVNTGSEWSRNIEDGEQGCRRCQQNDNQDE